VLETIIVKDFDETDCRILELLQMDARMTMRELGQRVGLSGPATGERVRRLEERGIIAGYRADVLPERLGRSVVAFVRVAMHDHLKRATFESRMQQLDDVLECHHLIGEDCYLLKVAVPSVARLELLIDSIAELGRTTTTLALSTPIRWKPVTPADAVSS
jgi:Lrp/AsnC family leucine-responsive transcriptional regulator